jgi:parallel beta-helix repeat protein
MRHLIVAAALSLSCSAIAETWTVDDDGPADFDNIQGAINASSDGDEILVEPGTYTNTGLWVINPGGKAITIRATGTAEETILDAEGMRRVVDCTNGEGPDTVIEGFMITGGQGFPAGGGIYFYNSHPAIRACAIANNSAYLGGGLYCSSSNPTITDCTIADNTADIVGGGIFCELSSPTITDCTISDNTAIYDGGGIFCDLSSPTITDCTITSNTAFELGGFLRSQESQLFIHGCEISGNSAGEVQGGDGIFASWNSTATMSGTGLCDAVVCVDTSSIAFEAESVYEISPELVISASGTLKFDIDAIDTDPSLNTNVLLESTIGSLSITNQSSSLFGASIGDVIPLVSGLSSSGSFSSVVFPPMPVDHGLELIEQSSANGGNGLAVEVIGVDTPDFTDPFAGTIDGPPIELASFDADGDGKEELAVLFGGEPGWIAAYDISEDDPPVLLEDLIATVGNNPVDLSAADVDGDGDDDLVIANAGDDSITVLINDSGLFTSSTISFTEGTPTSVAFMDWDSSGSLDVAIGVETPDGTSPAEDVYLTRLNVSNGTPVTGPSFAIPLFVASSGDAFSDPPTAVGGGETSDMWGFCGGTQYGRIHYVTAADGLQELAEVNVSINAIQGGDFDADGGDGHVDIAASSEEGQSLYLFQGEIAGFGDLIPISLNEPVEDFVVVDADSDGDFDFIIAAPDSTTADLLLLRNDNPPESLLQSLGGGVWSFQTLTSQTPVARLTSGVLDPKDEDDDWVIGGGVVAGFRGETAVIEQTNLLNGDTTTCPDINGDGEVGVDEILVVIAAWGTDDADADVNDDGIVDTNDLLLILSAWGPCP